MHLGLKKRGTQIHAAPTTIQFATMGGILLEVSSKFYGQIILIS